MLDTMRELASLPLPPLASCDEAQFFQAIGVMQANLPRRSADEVSGEIVAETYWRILGRHPAAAIEHLVMEAITTCQWFPTIKEALQILEGWRRADELSRKREAIASRANNEVELRFSEAMMGLAMREFDQAQIDALPERWKRIASERCYLWWHDDGTFTVRADK